MASAAATLNLCVAELVKSFVLSSDSPKVLTTSATSAAATLNLCVAELVKSFVLSSNSPKVLTTSATG